MNDMQINLDSNIELSDLQIQQEALCWPQRKEKLSQELMAIGKRCADHIHQPAVAIEHGDMLYGADGMPL